MLLYVRNIVVSLWGTVKSSTEQRSAHFTCAFCSHFSQKHLHFQQIRTKKQRSFNMLLESTFLVSQGLPYNARSSYRIVYLLFFFFELYNANYIPFHLLLSQCKNLLNCYFYIRKPFIWEGQLYHLYSPKHFIQKQSTRAKAKEIKIQVCLEPQYGTKGSEQTSSNFPERCREPASRLVGKARGRHSRTGLLPSLTRLNAHPGIAAWTHQQWFNLKGKAGNRGATGTAQWRAIPLLRGGGKLRREWVGTPRLHLPEGI